MLILAETPQSLLDAMSEHLSQIRDVRARHWLILPGRGRSEVLQKNWANRAGIAARSQEVELRELIEQAAADSREQRFDFDRLRLTIASVLPLLSDHPKLPIPSHQPLAPLSSAVLHWATTLAKAIDDTLLCRAESERWEPDSFLESLAQQPAVAASLKSHVGTIPPAQFERATHAWIQNWSQRGGLPHLWIQLDAGIPTLQFERFVQFIQILRASHPNHLHLFALSPSFEYWAESKLRTFRTSTLASVEPDFHPGGLLWALGQSSQDLHKQLSDTLLSVGNDGLQQNSPPPPHSLLGNLQLVCRSSGLVSPQDLPPPPHEDHSLTVHSTRSPLRELEICRDRILQALSQIPDLRYEEILVLLADPKRQAPYVDAAFRTADPRHPVLPFRLLGAGQSVPSPLVETLTLLLEKIRGRLELADLQTLLENPLIAPKFGFQELSATGENLIHWLKDANFRWGLDAEHRAEFQNIPEKRWNLLWALQRLGLGAVVSKENRDLVLSTPSHTAETVPLERASGLSLSALACLARFVDAFQTARSLWNDPAPKSIDEWNQQLRHLLATFVDCSAGSATQHLAKLDGQILKQIKRAVEGSDILLTADAYIRFLTEKLASLSDATSRGAGGISVGDLRQYAGVPARLTLITGLDDGTFPKRDNLPQWHPLSHSRKPGDPLRRDSDRHALLLATLACQQRLVLTYQGGSDEDSKERPPSTALADLLTAVQNTFSSTSSNSVPLESILFKHPLNGFSPAAFHHSRSLSATNRFQPDFTAARILERLGQSDKIADFAGPWNFFLPPLPQPANRRFALHSLRTLFQEPCRIYLERIGVRLPEEEEALTVGDLLEPNHLEKWTLRQQALLTSLAHQDTEALKRKLEAAGQLPRAQLGTQLWQETLEELPSNLPILKVENAITETLRIPLPDPECEQTWSTLEGRLKSGWFRVPEEQTAVFLSPSSNGLQHLLVLCIEGLMLSANPDSTHPPVFQVQAWFRAQKKPVTLQLPPPEDARLLLGELLPLLFLAQQFPLPLWPGTTEAALEKTLEAPKNPKPNPTPDEIQNALQTAFQRWTKNVRPGVPAEAESPATRYAFRGCPNPFQIHLPDPTPRPWLPAESQPLAWRLVAFLYRWKTSAGLP